MHRLGRIPPAEYEANHYARIRDGQKASDRSAIADNVLAETVNGLYKTELIYGPEQKPWRTVADVELATLGWVHWFNNQRLHGYLDDVPPAEYEDVYDAERNSKLLVGNQWKQSPTNPGRFNAGRGSVAGAWL